jgi:predicted Holliday junction resolvase-like endonuclease
MIVDVILGVIILVCIIWISYLYKQKEEEIRFAPPQITTQQVDLQPLKKQMDELPVKIMNTIQGNINNMKGELGEFIGYLQLHASYDRIIPINSITDFICVRLPKNGVDGAIDFVDCKTGSARLSKEQRALRKLIEEKKINFVKLTVQVNSTSVGDEDISE